MRATTRITELLKEDLQAVIPGSPVRLDGQVLLRLTLYFSLAVFVVGLFTLGRAGHKSRGNPFGEPPKLAPPAQSIPESRSI